MIFALLKGWIIRRTLQVAAAAVVLFASIAFLLWFLLGSGTIPSVPAWATKLLVQSIIGMFIVLIPASAVFWIHIRNNFRLIDELQPKNGDFGAHLISPKSWETMDVYALVDDELRQREKSDLHKIEVEKAKKAYECMRYYSSKNTAVISPAGEAPSDIRRGYINKVDFLLKKQSLKSEKYDTLRSAVSTMVHNEVENRFNEYIHVVEGLRSPNDSSLQESIDEAIERQNIDDMVEETEQEIAEQVEEKRGVEQPEEKEMPDSVEQGARETEGGLL